MGNDGDDWDDEENGEEEEEGFEDIDALAKAVQKGETGPLDAEASLGRIYSVDQLRQIARAAGDEALEAVDEVKGARGQNSCYERAAALTKAVGDAAALGQAVLRAEREQVFTLMSYLGLPKDCDEVTADEYRSWLHRQKGWKLKGATSYHLHGSPFTAPGSWHPRLEAVSVRGNEATLCFGQLRVLARAHAHSYSLEDLVIVRVPTVVTLLFDLGIMEVALPPFAEAPMPYHHVANFPQSFPKRAFKAVEMVTTALVTEGCLPGPPVRIPRNNLMIHLETTRAGEDLGWDIERMTGTQGEFDTTQSRRTPLKGILENFTQELREKCEQGGFINPLIGADGKPVDLYRLFRVLKAESHTNSMDLGVELGKRGGRVELTAFYGRDQDAYPPLYFALTKLTEASRASLREAAAEARNAGKGLKDPYDISKTLTRKAP